jgi:uncharacterized protein (TIGR04222 family)
MRRIPWLTALTLTAALAYASPVAARSLAIERFDADIRVSEDGTILVTEMIQVMFSGSWRGLYRTIPVEYRTPQGLNFTLLLDVQKVTDDGGSPLRWESSRERHYRKLKVYVPGAEDARRTIFITYRVPNALRFFEDHDELYWNVTGDEWDYPIDSAGATIRLPTGASGLRATVFTGPRGSTAHEADLDVGTSSVYVHTRGALGFHEGMTIAVGWDKGAVHEPGPLAKGALILRSNWPFALPILALIIMYLLWYSIGRDPRLRPIVARYKPPEGLTPAEVGTLVDDSADMADVTATIVDLAVRGVLRIEENKLGGGYTFVLLKRPDEWTGLKPHEEALLKGLFGDFTSPSVATSELENHFYVHLPAIQGHLYDSLLDRGYYRIRPDRVRYRAYRTGLTVGVLAAFFGGGWLAGVFGMAPAAFIISGIATAVIVIVFGHILPARTPRGARALEEVLGFEDFLGHVDADRFERTIKTPEMFEAFLPFAMALRVDKRWAAAFASVYLQPPTWYSSDGSSFDASGFGGRLDSMSRAVGSTLSSSPRSSGSSGDSGFSGGSSGGGGGGGGGGGF